MQADRPRLCQPRRTGVNYALASCNIEFESVSCALVARRASHWLDYARRSLDADDSEQIAKLIQQAAFEWAGAVDLDAAAFEQCHRNVEIVLA